MRAAFIVMFSALVIWGVGDVMRESDQASVIDGSIQLARDGQVTGRSFYNYDRTYGSYWVLSTVYKLMGLDAVGASMSALVTVGNYVAAIVLLAGLIPAFLVCGPSRWWEWVVWGSCLFSPVFLFSAPLLSSNVISAGFLFGLVVMLRKCGGLSGDFVTALLSFLAVAARADAVLVMPLIAFLSVKEERFILMLRDRRLWFAAAASVLALLLGSALYTASMYQPKTFFNPLLFSSFVVLGLNGALFFLLFVLTGFICWGVKGKNWLTLVIGLVVMTPLIFYWNVMYTPRHLMTLVLILVFIVMLPRGRAYLEEWCKFKLAQRAMVLILCASVVPMLVGVKMSSMKSGCLSVSKPTFYPTADGHWPMGANLWFYKRLHDAAEIPLDHNQRVWNAWKSIPPEVIPDVGVSVRSEGLRSLGELWLRVTGKKNVKVDSSSVTLFDGRSLLKMAGGVQGKSRRMSMKSINESATALNVLEVGKTAGEAIYAVGIAEGKDSSERWEVLKTLREYNEGDDFIVISTTQELSRFLSEGAYRWLVVAPVSEMVGLAPDQVSLYDLELESLGVTAGREVFRVKLGDEKLPNFSKLPAGTWVARSSLVGFMRRKSYE